MYLIDQRTLGIIVVLLLGLLAITKQVATGSILDKPKGNFLVQLVNIFNLFFLLVVNPLVAILLIVQRFVPVDSTRLDIENPPLLIVLSIVGMILYIAGFLLMAWALISLRSNYQLGGRIPRHTDKLVILGLIASSGIPCMQPRYTSLWVCLSDSVIGLLCCVLYLSCVDPPADPGRGKRIAGSIWSAI